MKRLFAFFLALVLLIGAVPVAPVHATEAEEPTVTEPEVTETTEPEVTEPEVTEPEVTEPEITVTRETIVPDVDLPGNDDLFAGYAQQVFYGEAATFGTAAGARLTGNEKILYDALVPIIKQIAAGDRTSTVIGIGQEQSYDGETYASDADATFVVGEIDTYQLVSALLTDLPYELYWYDKTAGTPSMLFGGDTPVYIQLSFPVAANYAAGTYAVDTAIAGAAETSAAKAQDIVTANAAKSDYEKLVAYKAAICDLVSYENNFGNFSTDNDPWQLIHVFDGDSSTNVVCEGYSKAFMYLCDQSDFSQNITCVTVSGDMGGPHMWNIVEIGGSSYLVDVTNSESGTVGQSGNLFLAGGTGSAASGYTVGGYSYTYDTDTTDLWGTDADSILTLAADNYSPNAGGNEGGSEEPTPCQHTYGDWETVTPATCNIVGTQQRTCADCGEVESQEIPLADHTYENGTCTVCGAVQPTSTADGFTYTVADGAVTITGYTGTETALVIPATIEGLPVTTIGEHAFQGSEKLVSVTIPDSVTTIGRLAFGACFALTDITIPEGVTTIGMGAFDVCTSLESITLPASVTTLGEEIFFGCSNLTTMILPATFPGFSYGMLTDCYSLWHILYKGTEAQWAAVAVAENNSCLANATVHCLATGSEVTDADAVDCYGKIVRQCTVCGAKGYDNDYTGPLGEHAFGQWTVVTPATCDTPGSEQRVCGVCNSSELRNTDLADHTYDENGTCTVCGYAPIPVPEGLTYTVSGSAVTITGYTGTETDLIIPDYIEGLPVTQIGWSAFQNKRALVSITLPNTVTHINSNAFWDCDSLTHFVFPEGVTYIGSYAFYSCSSLKSVSIPSTIKNFDGSCFHDCSSLTDIYLADLSSWINVEVSTSVSSRPTRANTKPKTLYLDGQPLTELIIPDGITKIPEDCFRYFSNIEYLELSDSVTHIDPHAFQDCTSLKEIYLPEGLRSIERSAFEGCTSLTYAIVPNSVTSMMSSVFDDCSSMIIAVVGSGLKEIPAFTFNHCYNLRTVCMTESIKTIEYCAFGKCTALECFVYTGTVDQMQQIDVPNESSNEPIFGIPWNCEATCCPPVVKASTDTSTGKPKLTWEAEPCAISYAIFRCATEDGEYDYVDVTLETSFVDTTAKGGKYYYIVVGISPYGELGFDSNVVSASVKCAAPTLVGSNKASSGKPVISWEAVEGAAKYEVYRATSKTGKYTKVKTTTATSYTDTDASAGKTYYYKVKTIASSSKNNSGYSDVVSQLCICAQPATKLSTSAATGKPVVSWKKVSGASKYEVYRSFTQDGEFELLATTAELTYTDKTAPVDTDCWYKVNAIASSAARNSIDAEPKLIRSSIARPGVSAKSDAATGKPVISWGAVEGAVSYKITRATKSSGTYYELGTTTELTYTDTAASRGKTYYYKVTAIGENCTGAASSYASCACRNAAPVITVTPKASTGKPVVKWEKVSGGKKYEVYRSASETGKYTLVKTTTSTSYTDTKATAGKTYFYKVRALASSSTYKSAYSTIVPCLTICAQPSVKLAVAATGKPVISWGKVSGASSYEIYRSNTQDGTYELVTATASLSYTDTAVAVDTDYWYKVNAIAANTDCNSIDAAPKLIHTTIAQPALSTKSDAATGKPVLSWDAVDGAVSYKVYRATKKSGKYKAVATVTEPTYTDTSASRGKTYYYKVRAYGENCSSVYSSIKSCASRNAAPVLTAAVKTSTGKPVISWKKVSGTKKYEVYRSTSENGTYTKVKTTTSTSYTDTKAAVGTTYYYKVRSVASSKTYTGAFSTAVPCLCVCGRPSVKVSVNSTYGKPYLSWGAVSGAQSYVIYRMDAQGNEIQLAEITATSYRDDAAAPDTDYSYKVNALGADAALHSADGSYQLVHATVAQPAVTAKSDAATGKPVLTWDAVDGAVSYKVYRATKKSGTYKAVATVTDPTYTDTAASRGKTYYYKVRAYGANCSSVYSSIKSCASRNAQPVVTVTTGSTGNPVLTWGKVSGTKKYEVYRSTSPDSGFTRVKSTTSLKFTDSAPAEGITYYYKVRSVASSSSYTGAYSQVVVFPLPQ